MKKRKISTEKILLFLLVLLAILGPVLSSYTYDGQDVTARNLGMSWIHWFGTDKFGRDLFTRVCCGIRLSLLIGAISAMICGGIGTLIGGAAGYIGGKTDLVLSELMNILSAVPSLLYIILIQLAFHPGMGSVILGFCVAGWVDLARLFRAETMRQKEMDIDGSKNDGRFHLADDWKVYFAKRQTVIESADASAGSQSDIYGSFPSFLGIGIAAPQASLGTLIQDAKAQITLYPLQMVYPVVILILLFLSLQGIITKEQRL